MATLKGVIRSAKAVAKGYSDLELKVRQATCNDKWGPSSHLLQELLMASELGSDGRVILEVLDRRLNDSGKNWRHVYKSLTVYQYLIESGPEYIVNHAKRNLPAIKTLKEYQYVDETGVDHGQNVRVKSRELSALLVDDHKLGQIRANRGKNGPTNTLQYSHTGNDNDDELQRAIELSREQASIDERRRKQLELQRQEEEDLQRAIEASEKEALDRRRSQIQTGKNLIQNDDIIDFFGSIEEPQTQFGNFDPFMQQQQMQWAQQEQQRLMMEQQQQQYFMQQQAENQRLMMLQQQEQNRQQMMLKQQQEQENARQQALMLQNQQNQFQAQYANHQNNPFAAPVPKKVQLEEPLNPADLSFNPNAVLDPFSKVAKIQNPSGPNIATVGGSTTQDMNPFSMPQSNQSNQPSAQEKKSAETNRYQYSSTSPESMSNTSNMFGGSSQMRPNPGLGLGSMGTPSMVTNSPQINNAQPIFGNTGGFQPQQQHLGQRNVAQGNTMNMGTGINNFGSGTPQLGMQPMSTGFNPMTMPQAVPMGMPPTSMQSFPDAFGGINPFENFQPRQPQQPQTPQMNYQTQPLNQQNQQMKLQKNANPFNF